MSNAAIWAAGLARSIAPLELHPGACSLWPVQSLHLASLLTFSLALSACASTKVAQAPSRTARDYAPYAKGASWTYRADFLGQKSERTVNITGKEGGYWVDDAGGRFQLTATGLRDDRRYLIEQPIKAGHSWKAVLSVSAVEHYEIVSVGMACSVPAGRFSDCLVVEARLRRSDKLSLLSRFTWARGVGLVQVGTELLEGDKRKPQTKIELLRYQLKPGDAPAAAPSEAPTDAEGAPKTWSQG